jgi:hypothetical protein
MNRAISYLINSNMSYKHFTTRDDAIIRARYPAEGAEPLAAVLGRKARDIRAYAERNGIRCAHFIACHAGGHTLATIKARCAVDARDADSCWQWIGGTSNGRPYANHHGRNRSVRALAFDLAAERPLKKGEVLRMSCGDVMCVNPAHMRRQSRAALLHENAARANPLLRAARMAAISRAGSQAKLTAEAADEIRAWTGPAHAIAARHGVSAQMVSRIRNGRAWKDYAALGAGRMVA